MFIFYIYTAIKILAPFNFAIHPANVRTITFSFHTRKLMVTFKSGLARASSIETPDPHYNQLTILSSTQQLMLSYDNSEGPTSESARPKHLTLLA